MDTIPTPTIIRSVRRSIGFQITPEGQLIVKAPRFLPGFMIKQAISEKEEWIVTTIKKLEKRRVRPKQYVNGEEFLYLGNSYKLQIGNYTKIHIIEDSLCFPEVLLFRFQKEMAGWYQRQAKDVITKRVETRAEEMQAEYSSIFFSDTKSKWGTCGPDNDLQFNWRLVMVPLVVLDYVVIHELAHTKEKNHSMSFWREVAKYTPAYKAHRKWLNNHGHLLHF